MTYPAIKLYKEVYKKLLDYKNHCEELKEIYDDSFTSGKIEAVEHCLGILKNNHMIFDMDDDF